MNNCQRLELNRYQKEKGDEDSIVGQSAKQEINLDTEAPL